MMEFNFILLVFFLGFFYLGETLETKNVSVENYEVEYTMICDTSIMLYEAAERKCQDLGSDWSIATIETEEANNAASSLFSSDHSAAWTAMEVKDGKWQWPDTPRKDHHVFYIPDGDGGCVGYCAVHTASARCGRRQADGMALLRASKKWGGQLRTIDSPICYTPKCVLCQRFPCVLADCDETNTLSVTGYYPRCECKCRPGIGGKRCSESTVDFDKFKTRYAAECSDTGTSITMNEAKQLCSNHGFGWKLATLPTENITTLWKSIGTTNGQPVWTGGGFSDGQWKWLSGVHEGLVISEEDPHWSNSLSCASDEHNGQNGYLAVVANTDGTWTTAYSEVNDPKCDMPKCVLCEMTQCKSGWGGPHCDVWTTHYGSHYNTEYDVQCLKESLDQSQAKAMCQEGWSLASPAKDDANYYLHKLTAGTNTWLSGSQGTDKNWRWAGGRFNNIELCVNSYCNWKTDSACDSEHANSVIMNPSGQWDKVPSAETAHSCSSIHCYACERTTCNISFDCFETGTTEVVGDYYPSCSCKCKRGFTGSRCETQQFEADNGKYTSYYRLSCNFKSLSYDQAKEKCRNLGPTWRIGALPTRNAVDALKLLVSTENAWIGAISKSDGWYWEAGQESDTKFSEFDGTPTVEVSDVHWAQDHPLSPSADSCSSRRTDRVYTQPNGTWVDIHNDASCSTFPKCYICEQSTCILEKDCVAEHTERVTRYLGNCRCHCKDGWGGPKCNIEAFVKKEKYTTEYYVGCDDSAKVLSYDSALSICRGRGIGWTTAAIPDNDSQNKLVDLLGGEESAWIAARSVKLAWSWSANGYNGRAKGIEFFTDTCIDGVTCKLSSGVKCGSKPSLNAFLHRDGQWYRTPEDTPESCPHTQCYACERSKCTPKEDCFEEGTNNASGFYPECECHCKPGYGGKLCDYFAFEATNTVKDKTYISRYLGRCANSALSLTTAKKACNKIGPDYHLATLPTANATDKLTSSIFAGDSVLWIGGSSQNSAWSWSEGRNIGLEFYNGNTIANVYSNWDANQPSSISCSDDPASYLTVKKDGKWRNECQDAEIKCYLCEISPCSLELDCDSQHAVDVEGDYGSCICHCKEGYGGVRCEKEAIIHREEGNYSIHYNLACQSSFLSYADAEDKCRALGDGWMIAAVPEKPDNDLMSSMIPDTQSAWIAGLSKPRPPTTDYYWYWAAAGYEGRAKGKEFATANSCLDGVWCNFETGRPESSSACGGHNPSVGGLYNEHLTMLSGGKWLDVYQEVKIKSSCHNSRCYFCERSPCAMSDCSAVGTISVSGWYPNCKCLCRSGFSGNTCSVAVMNNSIYIERCESEGMTHAKAGEVCQREASYWHVATTPFTLTGTSIERLVSRSPSWLGGDGTNGWKWTTGRLKEQSFQYTSNWAEGYPTTTDANCETNFLVLKNGKWENLQDCQPSNTLPKCVLCEAQLCTLSQDCVHAVNVSGYYPKCTCECEEGWIGERCDKNSRIAYGKNVSEYRVLCESTRVFHGEAQGLCSKRLGKEWVLASPRSDEANNLLASLTNESVWLSGYLVGLTWKWRAPISRNIDTTFANSDGKCLTDYCKFIRSRYDRLLCRTLPDRLALNAFNSDIPRHWIALPDLVQCKIPEAQLRCYACERFLCNTVYDCNETGTENVRGYYPNCQCICKYGYIGSRCEVKAGLDLDHYSTSFRVECEQSSVSYEGAKEKCAALGWQLATVPNEAAEKLLRSLSVKSLWLAGHRINDSTWQWSAGRLANTTFYKTGDSCSSDSSPFCHFKIQPDKGELCEGMHKDFLVAATISSWSSSYGTTKCDSALPKCYACERSICSMADCDASHTISVHGYFPECTCVCSAGWFGAKCVARECDIVADCRGVATAVKGTYPNCECEGCGEGLTSRGCTVCPFGSNTSCETRSNGRVLKRDAPVELDLSLNALMSAESVFIQVRTPSAGWLSGEEAVTGFLTDASGARDERLKVGAVVVSSEELRIPVSLVTGAGNVTAGEALKLQLVSPLLVVACCQRAGDLRRAFGAAAVDDTLEVGTVHVMQDPVTGNDSDNKTLGARAVLYDAASEATEVSGDGHCGKLFASPHHDVLLRALSPAALLIDTNNGYGGVLVSNLILVVATTVVHFVVVVVLKWCLHLDSFRAAFIKGGFPSMPIYVVYALLPGSAVAAGELTAMGDGGGIFATIVIVAICVATLLVPLLWVSRALYVVPMTSGEPTTCAVLYPKTMLSPEFADRALTALVGNYRFPGAVWPTVPVWSSVFLLIAAFFEPRGGTPCAAMYAILAVAHLVAMVVILAIRPHNALVLDIVYCLALLPVTLLSLVRAEESRTGASHWNAVEALLIVMSAVNAVRLGVAVCSPFTAVRFLSRDLVAFEKAEWVFYAKCRPSTTAISPEVEGANNILVPRGGRELPDVGDEEQLPSQQQKHKAGKQGKTNEHENDVNDCLPVIFV